MFNIDEKPTFTRTVTVQVPKGEGHDAQTFKASFNVLDDDEFDAITLGDAEKVKAMLRKMVCGMEDLANAVGEVVPFSEEILELMLRKSYVRVALVRAYYSGAIEDRAGN